MEEVLLRLRLTLLPEWSKRIDYRQGQQSRASPQRSNLGSQLDHGVP